MKRREENGGGGRGVVKGERGREEEMERGRERDVIQGDCTCHVSCTCNTEDKAG